jgi:signal transduction histidine kinase/ActR/RegA family two-component response regulator
LRTFVEQARARAELETARPVLTILTAFVALATVTDLLDATNVRQMTTVAMDLGLLFVGVVATIVTMRRDCPPARARVLTTLVAIYLIANIATTVALTGRVQYAANIALVMLGLSTTLLSPAPMILVATLTIAASLTALHRQVSPGELAGWLVTIGGSAGVAVTLTISRGRMTGRLALFRYREARRHERLARTADSLRKELALRHDLETERSDLRAQLLQAQKLEAIGTLAGGVAHDMNNVLAAITSLAEGVSADLPPESAARADLTSLLEAAGRGAELTRNLLAFGRKGKYRSERISMRKVTASVGALVSRTLPKRITLIFDADEHDDVVQGDPSQLQHALLNLVINAADAMDPGLKAGVIQVRSTARALDGAAADRLGVKSGEYVVVEVRDDGCGMDDETRRRAFEPFFTTKETGKGTGLGLAMVYGTAVGHGGGAVIESAPGRGTTVRLAIPRIEAVADTRISTPMMAMVPGVGEKRRVLLVDDEPLVRRGARRQLERVGYQVVEAENGVRALAAYAEKGPFDAVILDLSMPEMGGAECFKRLRALDPEARVLLASGYASDGETDALLVNGARGFLEKPYTAQALGAALSGCIGRRVVAAE